MGAAPLRPETGQSGGPATRAACRALVMVSVATAADPSPETRAGDGARAIARVALAEK